MVDPTGQKYPLEYFAVQIAPLILQFVEEVRRSDFCIMTNALKDRITAREC